MLEAIRIRLDSTQVYVTGVDADGRQRDIYQGPKATGAEIRFDLDEAQTSFSDKVSAAAKKNGDAEPELYQPEVAASKNARELAEEHGIDLNEVEGTGKDGKVRINDVEAFMEDRDVAASGVPADGESEADVKADGGEESQ